MPRPSLLPVPPKLPPGFDVGMEANLDNLRCFALLDLLFCLHQLLRLHPHLRAPSASSTAQRPQQQRISVRVQQGMLETLKHALPHPSLPATDSPRKPHAEATATSAPACACDQDAESEPPFSILELGMARSSESPPEAKTSVRVRVERPTDAIDVHWWAK